MDEEDFIDDARTIGKQVKADDTLSAHIRFLLNAFFEDTPVAAEHVLHAGRNSSVFALPKKVRLENKSFRLCLKVRKEFYARDDAAGSEAYLYYALFKEFCKKGLAQKLIDAQGFFVPRVVFVVKSGKQYGIVMEDVSNKRAYPLIDPVTQGLGFTIVASYLKGISFRELVAPVNAALHTYVDPHIIKDESGGRIVFLDLDFALGQGRFDYAEFLNVTQIDISQ
ncbi:hypothetical protein COT72_01135 [archaeon CG10_big_fil_rev_8_21_14_0_10_43_11]|nr:MAG: hypothetical protein COT72_01135 [archaeon CG10_big_fil_rev_8_21_14_0_10_43_11]